MQLAGRPTLQQVIDEICQQVWAKRYPGREVPRSAPFKTEPEWLDIRNRVREAVLTTAEEQRTPQTPVPPVDAEWQDQQRLMRIAAMAYTRTGF